MDENNLRFVKKLKEESDFNSSRSILLINFDVFHGKKNISHLKIRKSFLSFCFILFLNV